MLESNKKLKLVVIGTVVLLLICAIVVILYNSKIFGPVSPEPDDTTSIIGKEEVLNDHLTELAAKDPNVDYESKDTQTRFTITSPDYFYDTTDHWWTIGDGSAKNGAPITAFATAVSVLSDRSLSPAAIAYVAKKHEYWNLSGNAPDDLIQNLAEYYGLFYREVPAMNSNILNYYLDKDAVVVSRGKGKEPYSSSLTYLVVLGAYIDKEAYLVSSPTDANYRNKIASRIKVLSNLESDEKFYVLSGLTKMPDFSAYSDDFKYQGGNK